MRTQNGQIHTIIFDIGGVLVDWNPAYLYRKIFEDEAELNYFLREVCSPSWNAGQDAGRSWAEAIDALIAQHPGYELEIRAYYQRWTEMIGGIITGTVHILELLHRQNSRRLLALTNWSAETFPYALDNFPFLQLFEGILVSGQEKLKKPDLRIYQLLIDRYGVEPSGALFIDDIPENVESARAAGLHAVRFHSPEQLREDLARYGIHISR